LALKEGGARRCGAHHEVLFLESIYEVHRNHTGPQKAKLLHPTSHPHPQRRAFTITTPTALATTHGIVTGKEDTPTNAIVTKRIQTGRGVVTKIL